MSYPFSRGSELKIHRAKKHVRDLQREWIIAYKRSSHNISVKDDPDTGDSILELSLDQSVPDKIPLIVGDAVHNLMSALDFVINDIEFFRHGKRSTFTKFPVYETREKLVAAVNGGLRDKVPSVVIDFIVDSVQPYRRGNGDCLWSLHALDIIDKHRIVIAKKEIALIRDITCEDGGGRYFTIPVWEFSGRLPSVHICQGWRNLQLTSKGKASFSIVFGNGMPFYGFPILPTLYKLVDFVGSTVDAVRGAFLSTLRT